MLAHQPCEETVILIKWFPHPHASQPRIQLAPLPNANPVRQATYIIVILKGSPYLIIHSICFFNYFILIIFACYSS